MPITFLPCLSASPQSVTVGATSTSVLSANNSRSGAIFVNDSDETIYLSLGGTAVLNKGVRLNATGGAFTIDPSFMFVGPVTAICTSGNKNLCVTELTQVQPTSLIS